MHAFRAMSTDVTVSAAGDEEAIATRVAATFVDAEERYSRFRPDSELSALNRARGPIAVSVALFDALVRAREHVERTGGLFDPAIGAALIAAGYDRSFTPGTPGALDRARPAPPPPRAASFLEVLLEPATRTVVRPPHVQIDLGGMIKGATVDVAARHLADGGAIDAGGDAIVRGRDPAGDDWLIDVEDPTDPERVIATFALRDAAVATSAANRRRWQSGGEVAHHLIDPRTQRPATTDLLQVTVVAKTVELAEVLAKAAFLLGSRGARRFLDRQPCRGAVLVPRDGAAIVTGELELREVAA